MDVEDFIGKLMSVLSLCGRERRHICFFSHLLGQEATRSDLAKKDRHRVFLYREKTKAALIIQLAWRRSVKEGRERKGGENEYKIACFAHVVAAVMKRIALIGIDVACFKGSRLADSSILLFSRHLRRKAKRELMEARERAQKQMVRVTDVT